MIFLLYFSFEFQAGTGRTLLAVVDNETDTIADETGGGTEDAEADVHIKETRPLRSSSCRGELPVMQCAPLGLALKVSGHTLAFAACLAGTRSP